MNAVRDPLDLILIVISRLFFFTFFIIYTFFLLFIVFVILKATFVLILILVLIIFLLIIFLGSSSWLVALGVLPWTIENRRVFHDHSLSHLTSSVISFFTFLLLVIFFIFVRRRVHSDAVVWILITSTILGCRILLMDFEYGSGVALTSSPNGTCSRGGSLLCLVGTLLVTYPLHLLVKALILGHVERIIDLHPRAFLIIVRLMLLGFLILQLLLVTHYMAFTLAYVL
jgi:hypothetical protein